MYTTYAPSSAPSFTQDLRPPRLSASPPTLPTGGCRFILLHPSVQNQRCSCQAFHHNKSVPGSSCDCGHQACYHVHTHRPPSQPPSDLGNLPTVSNATLLDKIRKLEDALQDERVARQEETRLRQKELKEETLTREKEIRIIREALAPFYRSEEEIKRKLINLEDQVEGNYDEQVGLFDRLIALDDATDRLERMLATPTDGQKLQQSDGSPSAPIDRDGSSSPGLVRQEHTSVPRQVESGHIADVPEKRVTNLPSRLDSPRILKALCTQKPTPPSDGPSDIASLIDPNEIAISASGSPTLTPALAPRAVTENQPRSSGILDLSLLTQTMGSSSDTSCRLVANHGVDFVPSPTTMTASVQAFPKFTSALAPYDVPLQCRVRRFSDGGHRISRTTCARSVDLVTMLARRPNTLRELPGEKSLMDIMRKESRKRKRDLDEDGIYQC